MKADSAMWASKAISDYLRLGIPLEETRSAFVPRVFAAILSLSGYEMGPEWEKQIRGADRGLITVLIERVTGRLLYEITRDLARHIDDVRDAVDLKSWPRLKALPEEVWQYATAVTGMTVDEWEALPGYCRHLLSQPVECPICEHANRMEEFGDPDPITDPLDLVAREIMLIFNCPKCHARVIYDIQRRDSEQFGKSLSERSPALRWTTISIAAVVLYFIIRLIFR